MRYFNPAPFIAVAAVVAFAAGPAAAHSRLVSATPAPDSTVAAPRTLTLTFSERSVPAFSGFDVVNAAGRRSRSAPRSPRTAGPSRALWLARWPPALTASTGVSRRATATV